MRYLYWWGSKKCHFQNPWVSLYSESVSLFCWIIWDMLNWSTMWWEGYLVFCCCFFLPLSIGILNIYGQFFGHLSHPCYVSIIPYPSIHPSGMFIVSDAELMLDIQFILLRWMWWHCSLISQVFDWGFLWIILIIIMSLCHFLFVKPSTCVVLGN